VELKSREREESGHALRVLLLSLAQVDDHQPWPLRLSQEWISATPFNAPRHLKRRGKKRDPVEVWDSPVDFLASVLREEPARLIEAGVSLRLYQLTHPCPVDSFPTWVAHSLRSAGITPLPRYYEAVRPCSLSRYFRPRGSSPCAFSLGITDPVLKFPAKARIRVLPPQHRTRMASK